MTNMSKKILLASPHMSDEGYEQQFIKEAFDTNWIAPLGENVNKFEEEIANYVGVKTGAALPAGLIGYVFSNVLPSTVNFTYKAVFISESCLYWLA